MLLPNDYYTAVDAAAATATATAFETMCHKILRVLLEIQQFDKPTV